MSDRFKVRVWDVQNQKYLYFDLLNSESLNDFAFFADDETPDYNEQIKLTDTNCWALIIEQCTGLKDKNGKLIYDRDIVENGAGKRYFISWCPEKLGFVARTDNPNEVLESLDIYYVPWKVIGNIHENPELMENR